MTYVSFLEKLARHPFGVAYAWNEYIKAEDRSSAAKAIKEYINTNFPVYYNYAYRGKIDHHIVFKPHKYTRNISYAKCREIAEFFFQPVKVTKTFAYE